MRKFFLSVFFIQCFFICSAQQPKTVKGSVTDTSGYPLSGVTINLRSGSENLNTVTNTSGHFQFSKVTSASFDITFTSVGYETFSEKINTENKKNKTITIKPVALKIKIASLDEVIVQAKNPITIKEDTIEYNADAFKVKEGLPVEEVVKKLPGVTVDNQGNITAQGKPVNRIRVNGKDYFGGDVKTATQNLPAEIIDNIQIIDDYGDKANLTGIKEGEPEKIININIKKGMSKGNFGNATAGIGNKERFLAKVSANNFRDERQTSFLGSSNNTNGTTFDFNGGGKGGGARGANFGNLERATSGGNGNTVANSLGLNYRDMWGKKISSYGSISFASRTNKTSSISSRQDLNPSSTRITNNSGINSGKTQNYRVTWNIEYKIDSINYLKMTPFYSNGSSSGYNNGINDITATRNDTSYYTLNKSKNSSTSNSPSGGTNIFFNHKFRKKGRNLSVSSGLNFSSRFFDREALNEYHDSTGITQLVNDSLRHQLIGTTAQNTNSNIQLSYSEPLGTYTFLVASYSWNTSLTKSIRDVSDFDNLTNEKVKNFAQSNDYSYKFTRNRYGLSLNQRKTKYNFLIGIVAQPSLLSGDDHGRKIKTLHKSFNIAPSARYSYNFARSHSLSISYGGASSEPSFIQLQPVSDSSNTKNILIGNPNLKSEFTNRLRIQYNKAGLLTGNSFFANLSFDQTQNKIVRSVVNASQGTGRSTSYLNTNGFYGIDGNVSMTVPFNNRKFSVMVSASSSFDNNISYTDNQRNYGQNWVVAPFARFRIDIPDIIDFDANGRYTINNIVTNYGSYKKNTRVRTLNLGISGRNYFLKNWTVGYNFNKLLNYGYFGIPATNPTIINLYIECRFLKNNMGTLRLQGFDLLNQNRGISRSVSGTSITDVENDRLGQYFFLSFNMRLKKFNGKKMQRLHQQRRAQREPGSRDFQ